MHNITVFNNISLPLFFTIFYKLVFVCRIFEKSIWMDYFSIDEAFGKITMYLSTCFMGGFSLSYCPCSYLVCAYCIEMGNLKLLISSFYYRLYLRFRVFWTLNRFFILNWIWNHVSSKFPIHSYFWLNLSFIRYISR